MDVLFQLAILLCCGVCFGKTVVMGHQTDHMQRAAPNSAATSDNQPQLVGRHISVHPMPGSNQQQPGGHTKPGGPTEESNSSPQLADRQMPEPPTGPTNGAPETNAVNSAASLPAPFVEQQEPLLGGY